MKSPSAVLFGILLSLCGPSHTRNLLHCLKTTSTIIRTQSRVLLKGDETDLMGARANSKQAKIHDYDTLRIPYAATDQEYTTTPEIASIDSTMANVHLFPGIMMISLNPISHSTTSIEASLPHIHPTKLIQPSLSLPSPIYHTHLFR